MENDNIKWIVLYTDCTVKSYDLIDFLKVQKIASKYAKKNGIRIVSMEQMN